MDETLVKFWLERQAWYRGLSDIRALSVSGMILPTHWSSSRGESKPPSEAPVFILSDDEDDDVSIFADT